MATNHYTILTDVGAAKIANAIRLGTKIEVTELAVGDGGGKLPMPGSSATTLVNEWRRAPINTSFVDDQNDAWVVFEQVLPPDVGGHYIREIGLYDAAGDLIAIGNYPEQYKPLLAEGASTTQTVRVVIQVLSSSAVTLKVDPSTVLATRSYVDKKLEAHEKSRNHPYATTTLPGMAELATGTEAKARADKKTVLTPETGGLMLAEHEQAEQAHTASQILLDDPISGAKTVDEYAQRLNAAGAVQAQSINGQDMNDLTTSISFHHSYDDAPKNAPETGAGVGWIIALGNGDRVSQYWHRASAGAANSVYVRSITAGQKWSEWGRLYTSDNIAQLVRDLGFRSDHGRDGYSVFPDGTVHQWGATSTLPNFETVITTPIRWPNYGRSVVASDNNDSNPDVIGIGFRGNDQIVIQTSDTGLIYWFAVGY